MARFCLVGPGDRAALSALLQGSTSPEEELVEDFVSRWCPIAERREAARQNTSWRVGGKQNGRKRPEAYLYELENGVVVGAFTLEAAGSFAGSGSGSASNGRVAQCQYIIPTETRCDSSIHKALCTQSLRSAAQAGYTGVQLNMVSSADGIAVEAYIACGFVTTCALPDAFQVGCAFVEGFVMFCKISAKKSDALVDALAGSTTKPNMKVPASRLQIRIVDRCSARSECLNTEGQKRQCNYDERSSTVGVSASPRASPRTVSDWAFQAVLESEVSIPSPTGHQSLGGDVLYTIHPELPDSMDFNPQTGSISGSFDDSCGGKIYCVSASSTARVCFALQDLATAIDVDFAANLENIVDVADLPTAPSKAVCFGGDWMLWMVHRAYLDDPTLTELDFTGMQMPLPHMQPRIAPKLMQALGWNRHIEAVFMANSNLQNTTGFELAHALLTNSAVRFLNIESNCIDSSVVRSVALAIRDNKESRIEELSVAHQKSVGKFFGRPTEEALGQMLQSNGNILRLGIECDDKHWRNVIDRALLRNNDYRRQSLVAPRSETYFAIEERTFGQLILCGSPQLGEAGMAYGTPLGNACAPEESRKAISPLKCSSPSKARTPLRSLSGLSPLAVPHPSDPCVFRDYVLKNLRVPTVPQLQSYIRNVGGAPLQYTVAAPLIKEWLCRMLDAAVGSDVVAADAFQTTSRGILECWSEDHGAWNFDILIDDGRRFAFRSKVDPTVAVSEVWASWLANQLM